MGANDRELETTIFVRMPQQHKDDLVAVANKLDLSMSAIVRYAIKHYLYGVSVPGAAVLTADGDGSEADNAD
jgi:hypothetical protein